MLTESEDTILSLKQDIVRLEEVILSRDNQIAAMESSVNTDIAVIRELQGDKQSLLCHQQESLMKIESLTLNVESLSTELNNAKGLLLNSEITREEIYFENEKRAEEIRYLKKVFDDEKTELIKQNSFISENLNSLTTLYSSIVSKSNELESQIKNLNTNLKTITEQLTHSESVREILSRRIAQSERQLAESSLLKESILDENEQLKRTIESKHNESNERIHILQHAVKRHRELYEELEKRVGDRQNLMALDCDIKLKNQEIARLESVIEIRDVEIREYENQKFNLVKLGEETLLLSAEIERLNELNLRLNNDCQLSKDNLVRIEQDLCDKITGLNEKISQQEQLVARFESTLEKEQADNKRLSDLVSDASAELNRAKATLSIRQDELEEMEEAFNENRKLLEESNSSVGDLKTHNSDLTCKFESCLVKVNELETLLTASCSRGSELDVEVDRLGKVVFDLESERNSSAHRISSLSSRLSESDQKLSSINDELAQSELRCADLAKRLQQDLGSKDSEIESLMQKIESYELLNAKTSNMATEYLNQLNVISVELNQIQQQLDDTIQENVNLSNKVSNLNTEKSDLSSELMQTKAQHELLISQSIFYNESTSKEISKLNDRLDKQTKLFTDANSSAVKLKGKLEVAIISKKSIEKEMKQRNEEFLNAEAELRRLNSVISDEQQRLVQFEKSQSEAFINIQNENASLKLIEEGHVLDLEARKQEIEGIARYRDELIAKNNELVEKTNFLEESNLLLDQSLQESDNRIQEITEHFKNNESCQKTALLNLDIQIKDLISFNEILESNSKSLENLSFNQNIQIQELKSSNISLETEKRRLEVDYSNLQSNISSIQAQIDQDLLIIGNLKNDLNIKSSEIDNLKTSILDQDASKALHDDHVSKIRDLISEIERLESTLVARNEELEKNSIQFADLESLNIMLNSEIDCLKNQAVQDESNRKILRGEYADLQNQILQEKQSLLEMIEIVRQESALTIEKNTQIFNEKTADLINQIKIRDETILLLEIASKEKNASINNLIGKIIDLENLQNERLNDCEKFANDIVMLETRLNQAEQINQKDSRQLANFENDVRERDGTIKELNVNVDLLNSSNNDLKSLTDSLKNQINVYEKNIVCFEKDIKSLEDKVLQLTADIEARELKESREFVTCN